MTAIHRSHQYNRDQRCINRVCFTWSLGPAWQSCWMEYAKPMGWRVLAGACACSIRRIWVDLLRKNLHEPLRTWISMSSTFRHTRTYAILWGAEPVEPGPQICQQSTGWCQVLFSIGSKRYIYISIYLYLYLYYIYIIIYPSRINGRKTSWSTASNNFESWYIGTCFCNWLTRLWVYHTFPISIPSTSCSTGLPSIVPDSCHQATEAPTKAAATGAVSGTVTGDAGIAAATAAATASAAFTATLFSCHKHKGFKHMHPRTHPIVWLDV